MEICYLRSSSTPIPYQIRGLTVLTEHHVKTYESFQRQFICGPPTCVCVCVSSSGSNSHNQKVQMHMMDLMCSIILEGDGVTQELLDSILINLIPAHKVRKLHLKCVFNISTSSFIQVIWDLFNKQKQKAMLNFTTMLTFFFCVYRI